MKNILRILMLLFCVNGVAFAQIEIDITKGNIDPMPVAIPDFDYNNQADPAEIGNSVATVIRNDLYSSGLFIALDETKFLAKENINSRPNFPAWRVTQAKALLVGDIVDVNREEIQINCRLWDILSGKQIASIGFKTKKSNWRRAAHKIADFMYFHLTGEAGYFDSRIVFISESGEKERRKKRLMIMDQDGENIISLSTGVNYEVLTPRFSPNQQKIAYLALFDDRPAQVYIFDISSGDQILLGNFDGMTFAPRFSPDGESIIFSLSKNGNSDIYIMNLKTKKPRRLTTSPAIDTSPTMSPDGKYIAFSSDRGGSQQIYIMPTSGGEARRLTYREGSYSTPVWSPRGDLIAFTRQNNGQFSIGVIREDGKGERQLTSSYHNEGPSWAPNGRYLIYFKEPKYNERESNLPSLWMIDLTGRNEKKYHMNIGASDPAWSPILD